MYIPHTIHVSGITTYVVTLSISISEEQNLLVVSFVFEIAPIQIIQPIWSEVASDTSKCCMVYGLWQISSIAHDVWPRYSRQIATRCVGWTSSIYVLLANVWDDPAFSPLHGALGLPKLYVSPLNDYFLHL